MSEEQRKPAKRWYKVRLRIFVLLLSIICVVVVFAYIIPTKGLLGPTCLKCAYDSAKTDLQNAVNDYQNKNNGTLPTINGTVTINGSVYPIIDICSLLPQNGESLQTVIESLWCGNGSNDDNWDGGCAECNTFSSYIWAADDEGNIYSTCVGEYCKVSGVDGYQDTWP
jgi:hypothetical protein